MAVRPRRMTDTIYAHKMRRVPSFTFDRRVVEVFDDMIVRSVPFYDELQGAIVDLTTKFVQRDSNVYDLGCATGTTLGLIAQAIRDRTVGLYGLDGSAEMIQEAKQRAAHTRHTRTTFILKDLNSSFQFVRPSVVIAAFTLQFVKPLNRRRLIESVHDALTPNGCLILAEKVLGNDSFMTHIMNDLHHRFKRRNRYSDREIAQKKQALEYVLIPYRLDDHLRLLYDSGFPVVEVFFRWFNFAGLIAVKARP